MFGMNQEQLKSVVVKVLAIIGGFVAGKWGITSGTWEAISALVLAAVTVFWSFKANTPTSIVKAAEAMPEVTKIEVTPSSGIANPAVTGPKVTA
jgi:hypothetical protein